MLEQKRDIPDKNFYIFEIESMWKHHIQNITDKQNPLIGVYMYKQIRNEAFINNKCQPLCKHYSCNESVLHVIQKGEKEKNR